VLYAAYLRFWVLPLCLVFLYFAVDTSIDTFADSQWSTPAEGRHLRFIRDLFRWMPRELRIATLLAFCGLIFAALGMMTIRFLLRQSIVEVTAQGLTIANAWRRQFLRWDQIRALDINSHALLLDLAPTAPRMWAWRFGTWNRPVKQPLRGMVSFDAHACAPAVDRAGQRELLGWDAQSSSASQ